VEDAARAHLLADEALKPGAAVAGSVYFISQDAPVNLWDFVNRILTQLGLPPVEKGLPLPLARTVGGIMEAAWRTLRLPGEPRLTRFLANELALDHYYNIAAAKRDFGYRPQLSMDEAVERTVAYFKAQWGE
jgi:nucleoside-diphosphate-sugar epimerase